MIQEIPVLRNLFKNKTEVAIFFTAFLAEVAFGLYLVYRWGSTFESGDAISHLYIPSTVVNNGAQSNLANLGTVWLPMFHILVIPFVLVEPLYRTGFAGTIVNALATGGICVILYRLLGGEVGILAPAIFMANAFTLFFGATPMTEQTAIFFMVLATYYFKRYWEKGSLIEFMKCSLAVIFGTLTRYEVWFIAFLVALFFTIREVRGGHLYRLAYIYLPFWGVLACFFWNLAIFRDPLMFLNHPMAPEKQVAGSPHIGNLLLITNLTIDALYTTSGAVSLISLIALIIAAVYKRSSILLSSLILTSPIAFHLFAMYMGFSAGWFRHFYLSLAGLIVLPLFLTKITQNLRSPRLLSIFLLFTTALYAVSMPLQTNMVASGLSPYGDLDMLTINDRRNELQRLKGILGSGLILLPPSYQSYQALLIVGVKPSQIIDDYDGNLFFEAMREPWNYCSLVVIPKETPNSSFTQAYNELYGGNYYVYRYYNDGAWRSEFLKHYEISLELETADIFKLVERST